MGALEGTRAVTAALTVTSYIEAASYAVCSATATLGAFVPESRRAIVVPAEVRGITVLADPRATLAGPLADVQPPVESRTTITATDNRTIIVPYPGPTVVVIPEGRALTPTP